ncbi:MAG: hypothetical protein ACREUG_16980 [Steroidobacteraceae bacterium]
MRGAFLAGALALAALCGCSMLPEDSGTGAAEWTFQGLNATDWAQTVNTARRADCRMEVDPFTSAVIGHHPTVTAVVAMGVVQALAHYTVTQWLSGRDGRGWTAARYVWQALTIGNAGFNVGHNASIQLVPFGDGCDGNVSAPQEALRAEIRPRSSARRVQ